MRVGVRPPVGQWCGRAAKLRSPTTAALPIRLLSAVDRQILCALKSLPKSALQRSHGCSTTDVRAILRATGVVCPRARSFAWHSRGSVSHTTSLIRATLSTVLCATGPRAATTSRVLTLPSIPIAAASTDRHILTGTVPLSAHGNSAPRGIKTESGLRLR